MTIEQAINRAQVLETGHFIFADGDHATLKLEMDHLWEHPAELATVLAALARADGLPPADVILGAPTGGQRLAEAVAELTGLPLARLERVPGGAKQDFRFVSAADRQLALAARSPRIYEDVVTTLSSVAGVVKLLEPRRQAVRSLAVWRRGQVKPAYRAGLADHYLVEQPILSLPPDECQVCHPRA